MRALLVAPQPFFTERGTPIAVRLLAETLAAQGHEVDILTYPTGTDVDIPGIRINRCRGFLGIREAPIGFSSRKVLLDLMLVGRFWKLARTGRYDVVHAVEEMVYPALLLRRRHGASVVYDMDSSLAQQVADLGRGFARLRPFLERVERWAIVGADAVTAVCEDLAAWARRGRAPETVFLLNDVPVVHEQPTVSSERLRDHLPAGRALALYVGNLSLYQGIDLLVDAAARLGPDDPVDIVVIGGTPEALTRYRAMAAERGVTDRVTFLGPRPLAELRAFLEQADILLSPRTKGDNTPLKIYSYMDAERPILATDLRTHRQVLDESTALLVPPEPAAVAHGLALLGRDPALRARLARAAAERVRARYSIEAFRATVAALFQLLAERRTRPSPSLGFAESSLAPQPLIDGQLALVDKSDGQGH